MWRDQVNYFTRQIIKSQCFLSFFLWEGAKRGMMGRICAGSRSDILKKIFFKLILCQNVFCKCSTHAMYLKQKLIRTYFHMWFCILPLGGQTWFLFFFFFVLFINLTLLLQCFYIMKLYPHFEGIVGVAFLFVVLFSLPLMWSSTAPCCLKIILAY